MILQLIIRVEAPDAQLTRGLSDQVKDDLRVLALDSLQLGLQHNPNFQFRSEVQKPRASATPLLTNADLARHYSVTVRTVERWSAAGKIPSPVRVNGAPRWFPEDIT
jgi:hypothetical protein